MNTFKKLFFLFLLTFPIFAFADEFLDQKVAKFQKTTSSQEKTEISSELFFIADNSLKTGDSGKALLYFKTALALTPEFNSYIAPKIERSLSVFLEYTLKISPENCSEIKKRNFFLEKVSPDTALDVLAKFPKCFKEEKTETKIAVKNRENFENSEDIPPRIEIPANNATSEKKILFENFGEELAHIQRMNTFLPVDLIRSLQIEALKLIRFKAQKPELVANSIDDSTAMLRIPFSFDVTYPQPFTNDLDDRFRSLVHYKGQIGIPMPIGPVIRISNVVEEYFRKKRIENSIMFPVLPSIIVFKAKLQFKNRTETLLLPGIPEIYNKESETLFFPTITKNDQLLYMPDVKLTRTAFQSSIGLRLSNETIKELKTITIEIDKEATFELDKGLNRHASMNLNPENIGYEYTYYTGESGSMSGITINNKKEGLFYITEEGKTERKAYFQSDREMIASHWEQKEVAGTYCLDKYRCDSFIDLFSGENAMPMMTSLKCSNSSHPKVWSAKLTKTGPTTLSGTLPDNKPITLEISSASGLKSIIRIKSDTSDCPELKSGLTLYKSFEIDNGTSAKEGKPCFIIDGYFLCNEKETLTNNPEVKNSYQKIRSSCMSNGHYKACLLQGIYQFFVGNFGEAEMFFNAGCTGFNGTLGASCANLAILYSQQGKQNLASRFMMKACQMNEPIGCYTLGHYFKVHDDAERSAHFFNKTCEQLIGKKTCSDEVATFAIKKKYQGKVL